MRSASLKYLFIHLCQTNTKVIQFLNFAVNLSLDDKLSQSLHTLPNHQIKKTTDILITQYVVRAWKAWVAVEDKKTL